MRIYQLLNNTNKTVKYKIEQYKFKIKFALDTYLRVLLSRWSTFSLTHKTIITLRIA